VATLWLRPLPLLLVWLLLAPLQVAAAAESAASAGRGLAVVLPRAEGLLAPLAGGTQQWLQAVLASAGAEMVGRGRVRSATEQVLTGERLVLRGSDAPALAAASGASLVLLTELHYEDGQAEVRLRIHDGEDGSVVSATLTRGSAGELGALLRDAAVGLLDSIDFPSDSVANETAPSLAELGSYGRALEALEALELVRAWRELEGNRDHAAETLRREIERVAASDGKVHPSERSRLSNLSRTCVEPGIATG